MQVSEAIFYGYCFYLGEGGGEGSHRQADVLSNSIVASGRPSGGRKEKQWVLYHDIRAKKFGIMP